MRNVHVQEKQGESMMKSSTPNQHKLRLHNQLKDATPHQPFLFSQMTKLYAIFNLHLAIGSARLSVSVLVILVMRELVPDAL